MNKHPYVDAMVADVENFKHADRDGREVRRLPGGRLLRQGDGGAVVEQPQYDVFMTGAYQTWQYGPAGWLVDMNEYISDPAKTNAELRLGGRAPEPPLRTAWSGVPGEALGGSGAKQWAVPWGFELNSIAYNRVMFDRMKLRPAQEHGGADGDSGQDHQGRRASTASACAARAPGPPSTRASSRPTRTSARATSSWRAASCRRP